VDLLNLGTQNLWTEISIFLFPDSSPVTRQEGLQRLFRISPPDAPVFIILDEFEAAFRRPYYEDLMTFMRFLRAPPESERQGRVLCIGSYALTLLAEENMKAFAASAIVLLSREVIR
jgi:hypothetical protein